MIINLSWAAWQLEKVESGDIVTGEIIRREKWKPELSWLIQDAEKRSSLFERCSFCERSCTSTNTVEVSPLHIYSSGSQPVSPNHRWYVTIYYVVQANLFRKIIIKKIISNVCKKNGWKTRVRTSLPEQIWFLFGNANKHSISLFLLLTLLVVNVE